MQLRVAPIETSTTDRAAVAGEHERRVLAATFLVVHESCFGVAAVRDGQLQRVVDEIAAGGGRRTPGRPSVRRVRSIQGWPGREPS
jgi:hypothetical protein